MKKYFLQALFASIAIFFGACTNVNKSVAPSPSKYWKAPNEAKPSESSFVRPAQIKTNEVITEDKVLPASDKLLAGQPLNLADLVDIALENNTTTRLYWFQAKVYAAQKGKVESRYYPYVSVSASVARTKTRQVGYTPLAVGTYWATGYGPSLQMNWLLFDFGKRASQSQAALESLRAANFDYNQSIQDVLLNTYVAYFDLYQAQGNVKTALANIEDAKNAYDSAKARLENAVGNKQDELRAKANLLNAEYALQLANASVESARAKLAAVVGIEVSENLKIAEEIEIPESKEAQSKIEELMASALKERQNVLAAYSKLAAAKQNTKSALRNFLPEISAQGAMTWTDYTNDDIYGAPSNNYTLGAVLTWDIFTGFARKYDLISAKAQERAALQQLKETEIQIISSVWANFYTYKSSLAQLESARAAVEASNEAYKATETAYNNGVGTLTDLLNSLSTLSQARQQQTSAESSLAISIARLAHATGRLNAGVEADKE